MTGRHLAHDQSFDVVFLGDGNEFVNDATDEVFAHLLRQAIVEILRDHKVVQLIVARSGCIHADDEHRARNR